LRSRVELSRERAVEIAHLEYKNPRSLIGDVAEKAVRRSRAHKDHPTHVLGDVSRLVIGSGVLLELAPVAQFVHPPVAAESRG